MAMALGIVLIVFGVGFLGRGLGGVFGLMAPLGSESLDPISRLIDSISGLIKNLSGAPLWLASTVIGIILIALGAWIGGWLPTQ